MIRWAMRQLPDGSYEGMVILTPTQDLDGAKHGLPGAWKKGKPIKLKARSSSKAGALAKASAMANAIMDNPILSSVLPPGSKTAVKAIDYLAKSAAAGKLKKAAKKLVGKGAKRLAKVLKFW